MATDGEDPIFSNNDGSNCEGVRPRSLEEKQAAYSLLLNRGLIRIGLNVPAGAEFVIEDVADPNQCARTVDGCAPEGPRASAA